MFFYLLFEVGEVFLAAGGVGDNVEGFRAQSCDDGIVDYATCGGV